MLDLVGNPNDQFSCVAADIFLENTFEWFIHTARGAVFVFIHRELNLFKGSKLSKVFCWQNLLFINC